MCNAVSDVRETRSLKNGTLRRRRECFNGHRFSTVEGVVNHTQPRDKAIADAVVVDGMTAAQAATKYGLRSGSYVTRCVRKHYPGFSLASRSQRARRAAEKSGGNDAR